MTVKERINQFIDYKGIKINSFEVSIGVSKSYWNNTQKISAEVVSEILRVYSELSAEWIMRGTGNMLLNTEDKTKDTPAVRLRGEFEVDEDGYLKVRTIR